MDETTKQDLIKKMGNISTKMLKKLCEGAIQGDNQDLSQLIYTELKRRKETGE